LYGSFIRYSLPALTGAFKLSPELRRPGHEVDVMTDDRLLEIVGEENNDG
jgi:hypothetical protein